MGKNHKILLIGEKCQDEFIYGDCDRLNPEAPTPVFTPTNRKVNQGMAGNVEVNLSHLGLDYKFITNKELITKTRYVDSVSNYILLRVDNEPEIQPLTINDVDIASLGKYDAIVVSDYNKGLLTKDFLNKLFMFAKSFNTPTFMDTKKDIDEWASECTFIKINQKEFQNPRHNSILSSTMFKQTLIVTLGANGCQYNSKVFPTKEVAVRDVVGAGDTFLAGLVYGYLKTNNIENGIEIANKLSANVVSKRGVSLPNKNIIE